MEIANPIYDVVFKYMMEDNSVARLLVSAIIGEKVISLEPKPQERTKEKDNDKSLFPDNLTVYRLDFSANIETAEGTKLVLIEMQKASFHTDIMRFRGYLGQQYMDEKNSTLDEDEKVEAIQIYSIYFLGDDLKIHDTPVLSIFPEVMDVATKEIVNAKSKFIEALNHKCWVVQISCLKQRRRNELEHLLMAFDQSNREGNNKHILSVNEEDIPEKYRPLFRRLKMAASSKEVKRLMKKEDDDMAYIKDLLRVRSNEVAREKDKIIAQKDETIAQKDEAITQGRKENETLRQEIERLRKENQTMISKK